MYNFIRNAGGQLPQDIPDYTPACDITVLALCFIMFNLLYQTHIEKNKRFKLITLMLVTVFAASATNVFYRAELTEGGMPDIVIYIVRMLHYLTLSAVPYLYIQYLHEPLWTHVDRRKFDLGTAGLFVVAFALDVAMSYTGVGFRILPDGSFHKTFNIFIILNAMFMGSIFYMVIKHRDRMIKQLYYGLLGVYVISVMILFMQGRHGQTSFTCIAYFFPIIGMIFLFHPNPYDIDTGAVSDSFFISETAKLIERGRDFTIVSCSVRGFTAGLKVNAGLKQEFNGFFRRHIRSGVLYKFPDDQFVLTFLRNNNTDDIIGRMFAEFDAQYEHFRLDYKIVVCNSDKSVKDVNEYIKLLQYVEAKMPSCSTHLITEDDIKDFYNSNYIISELRDISLKRDLNDPRVKVFCQPVYNLTTRSYDTAEALMRLELERTGVVFPDVFIPLAEQNEFIHILSLVILNKTCRAIRELTESGYDVRRISVNFSVIDLRYKTFCEEVKEIITNNGIPFEKIAVEITESRSESDFNLMKQRVEELRELGIKFYLDDFGTGYSNFERIMEIPFDIIKFDRSMLIESGRSENGGYMVGTFAGMFKKLNYSVLFEGVENENDEQNCIKMQASYLQGYKYSRPIPIANLTDFLDRIPTRARFTS